MQKYVIALYIRLSIEDYKYDSLSIENQSLVLHEYAASMPEALNAEIMEFIDNGYSGTNFERPQVQKLIELVRANQIDCIIVKDFSRFGRNSIETGYFIERVFPLFHTRFISISDDFDVCTLLDTDDQLSYRRPGIGVDLTQRLRAGHWSIQRQLDLHGLRIDEAREALGQFIRQVHKAGLRCVRVVHGKGLGSPGKNPVLKSRVQRWLVQKSEVLAFVQARPMDGGAGALVVLLQPMLQKNHKNSP